VPGLPYLALTTGMETIFNRIMSFCSSGVGYFGTSPSVPYRVKKKGQQEYSALAMEYVRSFDSKWLRDRVFPTEGLLGSPDIQSLADMVNSFSTVRQMMIVPLGRKDLLTFLVAAAIPFLPLLLLVLPTQDLIKGVWKMLF
jgi:hypothetical protein